MGRRGPALGSLCATFATLTLCAVTPATSAAEEGAIAEPPLAIPVDLTPGDPPRTVAGLPIARAGSSVEATLANGLDVTIVGDPMLSMVAVVHRIGVGAGQESPTEQGLAHQLEHVLFNGTERVPEDDWWAFFDRVGGYANAWTSHDATTTLSRVVPEALPELLDLEADRFLNLRVDPAVLMQEQLVVEDEIRLRTSTSPMVRMEQALRVELLGPHPYGRPVGGAPGFETDHAAAEVQAFFEHHYVAENMHLIVVGPFETPGSQVPSTAIAATSPTS